MKYIIIKASTVTGDWAFPFTFANHIAHEVAARDFKQLVHRTLPAGSELSVHSAGFIYFREGLVCIRGSETLGIERQPEPNEKDARIFMFSESMGGLML